MKGGHVMTKLPCWICAAVVICGVAAAAGGAGDEGAMPDLNGAVAWLNSPPLTGKELRDKVVLVMIADNQDDSEEKS